MMIHTPVGTARLSTLACIIQLILMLTCLAPAQVDPAQRGGAFRLKSKADYLRGGTEAYLQDRNSLVARHLTNRFCADESLNQDEKALDEKLRGLLGNELRNIPIQPFYKTKQKIQQSAIFPILRDMPKGGLLHVHLGAMGSMDWILSNALVMTNCYVKWAPADPGWGALDFFSSDAAAASNGFVRVAAAATDNPNFSSELRARLTIGEEDLARGDVWGEFGALFNRLNGFVRNRAVFTNYLYDAFQRLWQDGVYYVEVRDTFAELQEEHGKELPTDSIVHDFLAVRDRMQKEHPGFDCRLILVHVRNTSGMNIMKKLDHAVRLRRQYPKLVVGFDLIASEDMDRGTTQEKVLDVLPKLRELQSMLWTNAAAADETTSNALNTLGDPPKGHPDSQDLPYYLHDGESAWANNDNLFDAVLLRAPRIGHGFNLFRYPTLYSHIRQTSALEICPISNQVLNLTPDLRTHPAGSYLNAGIQCVLASDDPAIFGNDGLSYDFWEALVAWNLDLATLKKLARNSILHSGLHEPEKDALMSFWEQAWAAFILRQKSTL